MKIEEAVKWMEEAIQETTECFEQCSPTLQKELIEQKEVFELAISALRSMPETTKPGWISVKERLPDDENQKCLWLWEDKEITLNEAWAVRGWIPRNITHWMPLPKPPEEG